MTIHSATPQPRPYPQTVTPVTTVMKRRFAALSAKDDSSKGLDKNGFPAKFTAGGIAGGISTATMYPIDTAANGSKPGVSSRAALVRIIQSEGFFAMFNGLTNALKSNVTKRAVKLTVAEQGKAFLVKKDDPPAKKIAGSFVAGVCAGSLNLVACFPPELNYLRASLRQPPIDLTYWGYVTLSNSLAKPMFPFHLLYQAGFNGLTFSGIATVQVIIDTNSPELREQHPNTCKMIEGAVGGAVGATGGHGLYQIRNAITINPGTPIKDIPITVAGLGARNARFIPTMSCLWMLYNAVLNAISKPE